MKKFLSLFLLLTVVGCSSINIPNYIHDQHPYRKTFYASYDEVHRVATKALEDLGWAIEEETDPALFEQTRESINKSLQQTLIFTKIRQFSYFLGSNYSRINVYLKVTADKATEVEIRYLKVTSVPFKDFYKYKNKKLTDRIFKRIEEDLK